MFIHEEKLKKAASRNMMSAIFFAGFFSVKCKARIFDFAGRSKDRAFVTVAKTSKFFHVVSVKAEPANKKTTFYR